MLRHWRRTLWTAMRVKAVTMPPRCPHRCVRPAPGGQWATPDAGDDARTPGAPRDRRRGRGHPRRSNKETEAVGSFESPANFPEAGADGDRSDAGEYGNDGYAGRGAAEY